MKMKNFLAPAAIFILIAMLSTVSFGCWNMPFDKGPGDNIKEERTVEAFSKLQVGGAFKVYLIQGSQEKLEIEADKEEISEIVSEVVGGKLKIYTKSNWPGNLHEMTLYITFKDLNYIDFSGAVEVIGKELLTFSDLKMEVSGAAELTMEINATRFEAEFSGASEILFTGACPSAYLELSGASELDASGMEFTDLTIEVSGASESTVWANGTLNIDASGASHIRYKGNPKLTVHESGASSVKPF